MEDKVLDIKIINNTNFIDKRKCDWISYSLNKNGKEEFKVLSPLLSEHIRINSKYVFARNDSDSQIMRYWYTDGYYKKINDDELKGYIKKFIPLELQTKNNINETFFLLTTDNVFVDLKELDSNENIINFRNGLLFLDTLELKSHTPDILNTIQIPCNYNPNPKKPENSIFDKFMDDLTEKDEEIKDFLLQFLGYSISNLYGYRTKSALFMIGNGDSGKTQLKKLATMLIGEKNTTSVEMSELERTHDKFGSAKLFGKRISGSNDMQYARLREMSTLKNLTGGDMITAEHKAQQKFDFTYKGLLWFCGNEMCKFGGDRGDWVYKRLIILNCNNVIPEEKQNPRICEDMMQEIEYIISLIIPKIKEVVNNKYKFDVPDKCLTNREEFKIENNSFLRFVNECCEERKTKDYDNCTTKIFYDVYKSWCSDNNSGYSESKKEVKQHLIKLFGNDIIKKDKRGFRFYPITLNLDTKNDYKHIYGFDPA